MKDVFIDYILPFGFILIIAAVWVVIPISMMIDDEKIDYIENLKAEAIERDYALYCPKDGQFAWKGECK
jgi:putative exporter of polyketide antibiotics